MISIYLNTEDIAPLVQACRRLDLAVADRRIADRFLTLIGDPLSLPLAPEAERCKSLRAGVTMGEYSDGRLCDHDIRVLAVDLTISGKLITKQDVLDWLRRLYVNHGEIHCGAIAKHVFGTAVESG